MILAEDTQAIDANAVIFRLEEAGATLLALPGSGWSTRLRTSSLEIVRTAIESYGWTTNRVRPPIPSPARITRMDETMSWISLIPVERYVLRRIVGARSLVHPITGRHLFPLAPHRRRDRCRSQGDSALACSGDRVDRDATE